MATCCFLSILCCCHCERSEAIHCRQGKKAGLLRCARNDGLGLSRAPGPCGVEGSGGARQILEGPDAPRLLEVLLRDTRPDFRKTLAALDHLCGAADMKLV